ncbi:hypothetical protein ACFONG_13545 [Uliginosibacterium paludis]|uniref:J domain-containing protein n=1 Tax=Uliginosibacterium paludis TaxID=1615952 RepID=A0ABV2CQ44_9RHOO
MFKWLNSSKPAPEALELETKLAQLEALEERYAEVQTEYVTLQNALAAFKLRYWRRVGGLYARLDALRAEVAVLRARNAPQDAMRRAAVQATSSQARASAEAAREIEADPGQEDFSPSDELRKYYRMAARIVHPDRAGDEADRSLRDEIMARVNVAYRDGHVHTIQTLIDEYQMRSQPGDEDAATRLIRTIRLMSRIREQIAEISQASASLRESGLYRLYRAVEDAEARGEDRLRSIEAGIERDIQRTEAELKRLSQVEPTPPAVAAGTKPEATEAAETDAGTAAETPSPRATGALVCSQAELEIARLLDELGLDFSYREPIAGVDHSEEREPAFTIRNSRKEAMFWEHLPVLDNPEARERWQARQGWFAARGFETGFNLVVTRDESDGSFDALRLKRMAEYVRSQWS